MQKIVKEIYESIVCDPVVWNNVKSGQVLNSLSWLGIPPYVWKICKRKNIYQTFEEELPLFFYLFFTSVLVQCVNGLEFSTGVPVNKPTFITLSRVGGKKCCNWFSYKNHLTSFGLISSLLRWGQGTLWPPPPLAAVSVCRVNHI